MLRPFESVTATHRAIAATLSTTMAPFDGVQGPTVTVSPAGLRVDFVRVAATRPATVIWIAADGDAIQFTDARGVVEVFR